MSQWSQFIHHRQRLSERLLRCLLGGMNCSKRRKVLMGIKSRTFRKQIIVICLYLGGYAKECECGEQTKLEEGVGLIITEGKLWWP